MLHVDPVYCRVHWHLLFPSQVPPFMQAGRQMATTHVRDIFNGKILHVLQCIPYIFTQQLKDQIHILHIINLSH